MAIKIVTAFLLISGIVQLCSGSAIPMWEFLSRGEKMSHLYSTFAKQVSDYCRNNIDARTQSVAQCKRDLLTYGLEKLQDMSDGHLDSMDPYQRGANDLIWGSMMEGHPTVKNIQDPSSFSSTSGLPAATVILATTSSNNYPKNPLFDDIDGQDSTSSSYAMGMEAAYGNVGQQLYREPQNHLAQEAATSLDVQVLQQTPMVNYLSGPMVIRVRPDGTPVEEDKWLPLPRDDDREAMQISREKLPTAEQIAETFSRHGRSQPQSQQYTNNYRVSQRH